MTFRFLLVTAVLSLSIPSVSTLDDVIEDSKSYLEELTWSETIPYPGVIPEEAVNLYRGISGQMDDDASRNDGRVWCQECSIVKSMDNQVISIVDEVTHTVVNRCQEYQCQTDEDWCLVTYFKIAADGSTAENKHERHECGSKVMRNSDYRCDELRKEDSQAVIQYCRTQRSGASELAISISILVSLLSVLLY